MHNNFLHKYYIGKHKSNITEYSCKRNNINSIDDYKKLLLNNPYFDNYYGSGKILNNYYNKYDKLINITFKKEIIIFSENEIENCNNEQAILGNLYKTDDNCINIVMGGGNIYKHPQNYKYIISNETKEKISNKLKEYYKTHTMKWKGLKRTDEEKKQISKSLKQFFKDNPDKINIYHWPEEKRKEMSEIKKKQYENQPELRHRLSLIKKQMYKDNPDKFKGRKMEESTKEKLSNIFKGKPNYKNRGENNGMYGKIAPNALSVIQYDMNMNVIKIWPTLTSIYNELHISLREVINVCKYKRESFKNCIWRYKK